MHSIKHKNFSKKHQSAVYANKAMQRPQNVFKHGINIINMEACFHYRIWKKGYDFYLTNQTFFIYSLFFCKKVIITFLILRKQNSCEGKSQNCEINSRNYLFRCGNNCIVRKKFKNYKSHIPLFYFILWWKQGFIFKCQNVIALN